MEPLTKPVRTYPLTAGPVQRTRLAEESRCGEQTPAHLDVTLLSSRLFLQFKLREIIWRGKQNIASL
jgi:hypothetical protein